MNLEIELVSKIYFLCEIQCFISFSSGYIDIAATYFTKLKRNVEMILKKNIASHHLYNATLLHLPCT